jgi:hypothetical protein
MIDSTLPWCVELKKKTKRHSCDTDIFLPRRRQVGSNHRAHASICLYFIHGGILCHHGHIVHRPTVPSDDWWILAPRKADGQHVLRSV